MSEHFATGDQIKVGDLLIHNGWIDEGDAHFTEDDKRWYPGHPCFVGRFLLVIRKDKDEFIAWDLDKKKVCNYGDDYIPFYMPIAYKK